MIRFAAAAAIFAGFILLYAWRFEYVSAYAYSWDAVDFALALERYDLLAMQPHFPGYPFFILGGMVLHHWVEDPAAALSSLNLFMNLLSTIPIYLIGRSRLNRMNSAVMALFIQSFIYIALLSTQPISEGMAIAVLWWYLWSLLKGAEKGSTLFMILPLVIFGILMGVRVSYLPFGLGLLLLWYADWKHRGANWLRLFLYMLIAAGFQLIWVLGVMLTEGSVSGFIQLAQGFVAGHFNDWGGAVGTPSDPVIHRFVHLLFHNLIWTGLFGQSVIIAVLLTPLLIWMTVNMLRKPNQEWNRWLLILGAGYFIYVLFAQNIDKPRHIAPLVGIFAFMLFVHLFMNVSRSRVANFFKYMWILIVISAQVYIGMDIMKQKHEQPPATYQLAYYLEGLQMEDEFVVYTWEETRVIEYLNMPYKHERIYTYENFIQKLQRPEHTRVFMTNHVVEGFKEQGHDITGLIQKTAEFSSQPLMDPIYHQITLYEWAGKR